MPQYESVSVEVMMEFAQENPLSLQYFPDPKERGKLPRQFIINVLNTVTAENFRDFVHQKLLERNSRMLIEQ